MNQMASKTIGIVLSLKDKYSQGFKDFKKKTELTDKDIKRLNNRIKRFGREAHQAFTNMAKRGVVAVGALGTAIGGMSLKKGFEEAFNMEGYRAQLETATKDTKKAADIMRYSIGLANKTPFEGGDMVEAAAKFEAMGMSAKKWLTLTGDMAGATNKSLDQATEAIIDAQTGELERLKEFGIKKADIAKKADEMFAGQEVVNAKGQIADQEKFNEALVALMQDRFAGGMEKLAGTTKGMWSTVTGITKSALATMVGMNIDGSVRAGSALDILKEHVQKLSKSFEQWQNDGTIDQWAQRADQAAAMAVTTIKKAIKAFKWLKNNADWLVPSIAGVVAAVKTLQILKSLAKWVRMVKAAMSLASAASLVSPMTLVAIAIGVVIAGLVAIVMHWDEIKKKGVAAIDKVKGAFSRLKKSIKNVKVPGWIGKLGAAMFSVKGKIDLVTSALKYIRQLKPPKWLNKLMNKGGGFFARVSGHATGTSYFAGGATYINEGGRGELAILPSGTQIIPHDLSKKMTGDKTTVTVVVKVLGNIIGNDQYADWLGNRISRKVLNAMGNM